MPQFRYTAATTSSEPIEGQMEAPSKSAVIDRIHALGQIPIRIEEVGTSALAKLLVAELVPARRISVRSLALLTHQLATLQKAGLALDEALLVLQDLVETKSEKECLRLLVEKISGGATLADAMAAQKGVFPEFYVSMVRAGEAGATLDAVLERLAEFLERSQATKEHIKSALLYPALVAVTCCASIAVLFIFVVPRFRPLFDQSAGTLPLAARSLLAFSDFLQLYWWIFILVPSLIGLVLRRQIRNPERLRRWDQQLLKVPVVGDLIRKIEVARFSRTLGTLLKNGVSLLSALLITRETIRNKIFAEAVMTVVDAAKTGRGLAEPLRRIKLFPPLAVHLVRVGEESGRQEEMLLKIADIFDAEIRRSIDRLLALLAPAVTVVLGIVVAVVIISIMSALLSVYDLTL
jgi:general secretion pathway protein F